jgi:hypothetical protein
MKKTLVATCIAALCLGLAWAAVAAPAELSLTRWAVAGGGQTLNRGEGLLLGGTAGQPDAGVLRGGEFTLGGGFWQGGKVAMADHGLYLPLVVRGSHGTGLGP